MIRSQFCVQDDICFLREAPLLSSICRMFRSIFTRLLPLPHRGKNSFDNEIFCSPLCRFPFYYVFLDLELPPLQQTENAFLVANLFPWLRRNFHPHSLLTRSPALAASLFLDCSLRFHNRRFCLLRVSCLPKTNNTLAMISSSSVDTRRQFQYTGLGSLKIVSLSIYFFGRLLVTPSCPGECP